MTSPGEAISVALVHDEGAGALFLAHVCNMLERLAARAGVRVETESSTTLARIYRLPVGTKLPRELEREIGIHRAQLVPDGSASGRVVTIKVEVTTRNRDTSSDIIRTYNFPSNYVTIHGTGERVDLDIVLAGKL